MRRRQLAEVRRQHPNAEAISGWRNLMNGPALLFWVLRDEPPKRAGRAAASGA